MAVVVNGEVRCSDCLLYLKTTKKESGSAKVQKTELHIKFKLTVLNLWVLDSGSVVNVRVRLPQTCHRLLHLSRRAVIAYEDAIPIARIVKRASSARGIQNNIDILSTARDQDIDIRHIVALERRLRPIRESPRDGSQNIRQRIRD